MNKQELCDKINQLPSVLGWQGHGAKVMVAKDSVLELVRHLEEPQKVTVPKFVAEWIESHKKSFSDASAIDMYDNLTSDNRSGYYHEEWLWVIAHHHDFIKAWHDGYEVEQEKLYTVEIPNNGGTLVLASINGRLNLQHGYKHDPTKLTEAEIRKGFDWAWQAGFAKEVE